VNKSLSLTQTVIGTVCRKYHGNDLFAAGLCEISRSGPTTSATLEWQKNEQPSCSMHRCCKRRPSI